MHTDIHRRIRVRNLVVIAAVLASATVAAAQAPDAATERTKQRAGQSGAATSHTITPDRGPGEAHEITSTATGSVSLSAKQRQKLRAYFSRSGTGAANQATGDFTVSVGAAVPKQVPLQPFAPELQAILPTYKGDQYVAVQHRLVIATPERRIVAIIPGVSG